MATWPLVVPALETQDYVLTTILGITGSLVGVVTISSIFATELTNQNELENSMFIFNVAPFWYIITSFAKLIQGLARLSIVAFVITYFAIGVWSTTNGTTEFYLDIGFIVMCSLTLPLYLNEMVQALMHML
jgi:hypothetical protein